MTTRIVLDLDDAQANSLRSQLGGSPVPIPPPNPNPTPIPPPTQGDGLDAARVRQQVSQNCLWSPNLLTPTEASLLQQKVPGYSTYMQFYTPGGSGSVAPTEAPDPASPSGYSFQTYVNGQVVINHDVSQAADRWIEQECINQGRPPPPAPAVF